MKRALCSLIGRSLLVALALGGTALAVPSVAAANPACGATVTHNVTLTSDMDCSASATNGINVGKPGITINLNGHTLTGPGSGNCCNLGIVNTTGYDKVTVENGTVKDYFDAVQFYYTTGTRILHFMALGNNGGLDVENSQDGVIDHSTVSRNTADGIHLLGNNNVKVTSSTASHNGLDGVDDNQSLGTLDHVTANANGGWGVYVDHPATSGGKYYTIENSTANTNFQSGFQIADNFPTYLYQAIVLDNTANDNGQYGFFADLKTKGKGNHATGNGTANCFHVRCG
jgi:parallel beta-helix repeat protein